MFMIFIITLLLGTPIYASVGISTLIPVLVYKDVSPTMIVQTFFSGIDNYVLISIALFIISGAIMQASGMTEEILGVADAAVGKIPGGIGISTILASTLFAALTGSGLAATIAIGSITVGGMIQRGYPKELAGAISASGGTLGVLIPPSNPLILYGVISSTSIGALFIAGFIPGILIALSMAFVMYLVGIRKKLRGNDRSFSFKELILAIWRGKWGLFAPVIILGSIYSGIATPMEAAELAVFYALFYGLVIKRNIGFREITRAFSNGTLLTSVMLALAGVASGFGRLVTIFQVPQKLASFISNITSEPEMVLLLILGMLVVTGMFMETLSQIIILTPILLPVITQLGVNPIVFGIFLVVCIEIGFLTPPIGGNLFAATKISNSSLLQISKEELPFISVLFLWVVIFIFYPEIIMLLPNLLY